MLLETGVLLIFVTHVHTEEGCPERCKTCVRGVCLACVPGYYGFYCESRCSKHCKDRLCTSGFMCNGCVSGRYGLGCDKQCHRVCKDGHCDQVIGYCYDSPSQNCVTGVCSSGCEEYCHDSDSGTGDQDYSGNEDKTVLSSELIIGIALTSVAVFVICFCFLIKYSYKKGIPKNTNIAVIPPGQKPLPGEQLSVTTSSNRTDSNVYPGNDPLNSDVVMAYPRNDRACAGYTDVDVTSFVVSAEIPPPVHGQETEPPPSYESLFMKPVTSPQ